MLHHNAAKGLVPVLEVRACTWTRDSHDLFDYESRDLVVSKLHLKEPSRLWREGATAAQPNSIVAVRDSESVPADNREPLAQVIFQNGKWLLSSADARTATGQRAARRMWHVVKYLPDSQHQLTEGDQIKIGRFRLRVKQITPNEGGHSHEVHVDDDRVVEGFVCDESSSHACKICLGSGADATDPFIAPCQCSGTAQNVHLGCLRGWIRSRCPPPEPQSKTFLFKQLPCEICKARYPARVSFQGATSTLVEMPSMQAPFVVLEHNSLEPSSPDRLMHVLSLAGGKPLRIGRGHESDVRIADVSISRCHATLGMKEGSEKEFLLRDNKAKFGTLVFLKRPRPVDERPTAVQVGRTLLAVKLIYLTPEAAELLCNAAPEKLKPSTEEPLERILELTSQAPPALDAVESNEAAAAAAAAVAAQASTWEHGGGAGPLPVAEGLVLPLTPPAGLSMPAVQDEGMAMPGMLGSGMASGILGSGMIGSGMLGVNAANASPFPRNVGTCIAPPAGSATPNRQLADDGEVGHEADEGQGETQL